MSMSGQSFTHTICCTVSHSKPGCETPGPRPSSFPIPQKKLSRYYLQHPKYPRKTPPAGAFWVWGRAFKYLIPISACALFFILLSCTFKKRPWTSTDYALAGLSCAASVANYAATEAMLDRGGHEWNPVYGDHPSDTELAIGFGLTQLTTLAVAHWAPVVEVMGDEYELRVPILVGKTAVNAGLAIHDHGVGR